MGEIVLRPPIEPMLARAVDELPHAHALSGGCAYEPKVDGYRALLFISEEGCYVQSRRGKDISASFPDIAAAAAEQLPVGAVVDGELAILGPDGALEFAALQRRIASPRQARTMAAEQPASFVAFDLLSEPEAGDLRRRPLVDRRRILTDLLAVGRPPLQLSPHTSDYDTASAWMHQYAVAPVGLEGVVVKGLASRYEPGLRGWLKVRIRHTVEAVVGAVTGSRKAPERLILGMFDADGELIVIGATSALSVAQARTVSPLLNAPEGAHAWPAELPAGRFGGRDYILVDLVEPTLVVEVSADNAYAQGRWRHLTRFMRVRPDLAPDEVSPPWNRA